MRGFRNYYGFIRYVDIGSLLVKGLTIRLQWCKGLPDWRGRCAQTNYMGQNFGECGKNRVGLDLGHKDLQNFGLTQTSFFFIGDLRTREKTKKKYSISSYEF